MRFRPAAADAAGKNVGQVCRNSTPLANRKRERERHETSSSSFNDFSQPLSVAGRTEGGLGREGKACDNQHGFLALPSSNECATDEREGQDMLSRSTQLTLTIQRTLIPCLGIPRFGSNRPATDMEGSGEFDFWVIYEKEERKNIYLY